MTPQRREGTQPPATIRRRDQSGLLGPGLGLPHQTRCNARPPPPAYGASWQTAAVRLNRCIAASFGDTAMPEESPAALTGDARCSERPATPLLMNATAAPADEQNRRSRVERVARTDGKFTGLASGLGP